MASWILDVDGSILTTCFQGFEMRKLFDFTCSNCGKKFEKLRESDCKLTDCPECGFLANRNPVQSGGYRRDHTIHP
jgi:putative FmdB family regulatory protein